MIDPRRLAFDIDGVITDTMRLFIDIAREVYGIKHIVYGDMTQYDLAKCLDIEPELVAAIVNRITDGNYPCSLRPIDGAVSVLNRLSVFGPLRMVTARPRLGPIRAWMADHLDPVCGPIELTATGSFDAKPELLKAHNIAHYVDDRLDSCYLLRDWDIIPILFAQPWNRASHPFVEVSGWRQLEALIDWRSGQDGESEPLSRQATE